jgi:tRNA(Ile)-lysidine synthase
MLEDFINFVQKENLFRADEKILVAVSGGMDSMVLSKLFSMAKFNFGIAHVNFSLRGEESLADEVFVKKWAKTLKVPYYSIVFDTKAFAEKEKLSIQVAARMLRYAWFEEIRVAEGYAYIATAHQAMDQAETVLINLSRGTGIAGFHGIPVKNGHVIRPMAFASQEDLFDFVVAQKLTWREDSSNESTKYVRNFIRHEIIPKFEEINPQFEQSVLETSRKIQGIEAWMREEMDFWRSQHVRSDAAGNIFVGLGESASITAKMRVLYEAFLKEFDFTYGQMDQLLSLSEEKVGQLFESPTHVINHDRGQWVISRKSQHDFRPILVQEEDEEVLVGSQKMEIFVEENGPDYSVSTSPKVACVDADALTFPLEIRKYQEGDWFCPLGMNTKKLISDFLTDRKVPLLIKKETYLLLSKGSVVWVMGHRIDNRFKVSDKTETVMVFTLP